MVKIDASEKLRRMYFAMGVAMTQWQHVEMGLTQLFTLLVQSDSNVASAVFNAVPSLPTKLKMVRAAASVRLPADLAKECFKLCGRLDQKAKKRNEIAHFMLYQVPVMVTPETEITPEQMDERIDWYLAPTFFDSARHWRYRGALPELKTNDLMNRAQ